jgi:hypothetical protein
MNITTYKEGVEDKMFPFLHFVQILLVLAKNKSVLLYFHFLLSVQKDFTSDVSSNYFSISMTSSPEHPTYQLF